MEIQTIQTVSLIFPYSITQRLNELKLLDNPFHNFCTFLKTDANVDLLVSEQATFIITQTGLIELYRKAAAHQPSQVPCFIISLFAQI